MIKLPEPVGQFHAVRGFFDVDAPTEYEKSLGWEAVYTESELKQFGRDLLEKAAKTCEKQDGVHDAIYATAIRALIKEI